MMAFYPVREKVVTTFLLLLCILFLYLWITISHIVFIILFIVFIFISIIWISPMFTGIKRIEIDKDNLSIVFAGITITFLPTDLYEIIILKNGIRKYRFNNGTIYQQVTSCGYIGSENFHEELDRIYKPYEKKVKITKK